MCAVINTPVAAHSGNPIMSHVRPFGRKSRSQGIGWGFLIWLALGVANMSGASSSGGYQALWEDPAVTARIEEGIRTNRMAQAVVSLAAVRPGTEVLIEQTRHAFLFGGNAFLFGDLKTPEKNRKYEETFGTLFNAATVAFYWKTLEKERGKPRFAAGSSYEYRRPPTDPVVAHMESKGISMNGHAIIYGMRRWGHPDWMPEDRQAMEPIFEDHVRTLAQRYGARVQRWDVVNESIDQANRGLMPDDYTCKTFRWAGKYFPAPVQLGINDCDIHGGPSRRYVEIVRDLIDRGVRVDTVGVQMHIYNASESQRIADGADLLTPAKNWAVLDCLKDAGRPIHISEVTVTAPDDTEVGKEIQAMLARNLYRLWFSYPEVMGITWWNVVDGGAAAGEPSYSGLYDTNLMEKPVYRALDQLINREWKTRLNVTAKPGEPLRFRGFKGSYRVSWTDNSGEVRHRVFNLVKDGDGQLGPSPPSAQK
jgi:endo-1,4-beta-xylanase